MNIRKPVLFLILALIIALFSHQSHLTKSEYENLQSVVMIENYTNNENSLIKAGTGFVVKNDIKNNKFFILTNFHVCNIKEETFLSYVRFDDPNPYLNLDIRRKLKIVKINAGDDLCLLEANNDYLPSVEFSTNIKMLDEIYIIGAPHILYPIFSEGRFMGYSERVFLEPYMNDFGEPLLFLSTPILAGHSGSPIFNKKGQVIGIVFAAPKSEVNIAGYGISTKSINNFLTF